LWQDVSMDIIAIWFFLWSKIKYVFLFCMSMKENLVITIWFGFVRDNMTCNNTMLGFAMDFENGIKGKKNWLYIFLVINALILSNLCCSFCILLFQFQFMKTFVLFNYSCKYYVCFLIKGFVCFNLSCNFCICLWVKSQSKEPSKWVDIFLNYIFVCLKDHKGSIIVWILITFLGIFFINWKFYMLKIWHKSKRFLHVQSIQTSKVDTPCYFLISFFLPNVHHSFWKLKIILKLMIRRAKGLELMKIVL